jgi:uncharacterized membrane protein YcaP (DUF421 family)
MGINWHDLFVPTVSLWEIILRGSVIYLFLVLMMRLFRRDSGALGTADLMVIVIIADAAQNALSADYHSLTEGALLITTIFAWNYGLDWLSFRSPAVRRLLQPDPLLLVNKGVVQRKNLRSEMLTLDDLKEQLREHGVDDISQVRRCYLEADGRFSVLLFGKQGGTAGEQATAGQQG